MSAEATGERLRVAVVGCGAIGALHAAAIAASPDAVLAGVCDVHRERAESLAARWSVEATTDVQALLDRASPQAVTIATPDDRHVEPATAAIEAGCHVFCEKPLATSASAANELVAAAERRRVFLSVDYNRRYGFGYRTARRLIDEGRIGEVKALTIHVADRTPSPRLAREPAVMLSTLLTHHFDLVEHLGGAIEEIFARSGPLAQLEGGEKLLREFVLVASLRGGAVATITGTYRDGLSRTVEQARVDGETGSLAVTDVTREVVFTQANADETTVFTPDLFATGDAFEATIVAHVRDFLERVRSGQPPLVSGRVALQGLWIIEAARESLKLGRPVQVTRLDTGRDRI